MAKSNYEEHREEFVTLFSKDYEKESANGNMYPTNRIVATVVPYSWNTENGVEYEGVKVRIQNQKLTTDMTSWNVQVAQKAINRRVYPDEKKCDVPLEQFLEMLKEVNKEIESVKL